MRPEERVPCHAEAASAAGMLVAQAVACTSPEQGGPSRSVPRLSAALARSGLHVRLLTLDLSRDLSPNLRPASKEVDFREFPGRFHRRAGLVRAHGFRRWLQRELAGCAVIHSHALWLQPNRDFAACAERLSMCHVVSPRGALEAWSLRYHGLKKRIAWWAYQAADLRRARAFHATSELEAESIRRLGFRQPIAVIPNGIELPAANRELHQLRPHRTALFLSRIHPVKGVLTLLDAWKASAGSGWRLKIAGPDQLGHLAEARQRARELGIDGSVEFVGPVSDSQKWDLYKDADLFVLPTYSENFGVVIAEALGAGLPVITTKSAPWEEIEVHRCGWWVDTGITPCTEALRHALAMDPVELHAMGARGRALVGSRYSWSRIAEDMTSFYEYLVRGSARPAPVALS